MSSIGSALSCNMSDFVSIGHILLCCLSADQRCCCYFSVICFYPPFLQAYTKRHLCFFLSVLYNNYKNGMRVQQLHEPVSCYFFHYPLSLRPVKIYHKVRRSFTFFMAYSLFYLRVSTYQESLGLFGEGNSKRVIKPERIIIVRHGESLGNLDESVRAIRHSTMMS